ncbi:flagellar biosynthetic protein FliR [Candidatus Bealeia paramacronuclearis]
MVVFCRVAGVLMVLPGFSENYILGRMRVLMAMLFSLVMTPVLSSSIVTQEIGSAASLGTLLLEFGIGVFIGTLSRIAMSAMDVAGNIIGFQINLANASVFNPAQGDHAAVTSSFLGMMALIMIFVLDLHHLMIRGMVESFEIIRPGYFPLEDMSQSILHIVAQSFMIGVKMSAPFIIIGTLYYISIGLINRLLPQVQFFFVAQPLVLALGIIAIYATLQAIMTVFLDFATPVFAGLR